MAATRVEIAHDGTETVTTLPGTGGVKSSTDFNSPGLTVQRGFGGVSVANASELQETDVITIDGVEMTVATARSVGVLRMAFEQTRSPDQLDPPLSAAAASQAATPAETSKSNTGHTEYDGVVDGLNAALDEGLLEYTEAAAYDLSVAEIAMSGLSIEHALETLDGIADGSVVEHEVPSGIRQMLAASEDKVTAAATKSAMAELGADAFGYLERAASTSPEVAEAIRGYAIRRATGRTEGARWSDLYEDVRAHLGG